MLLDFLSAKERAPAECLVKVNGQEISALYPFLLEITVQCGRAEAATASVTFETRRDELGRWTQRRVDVLDLAANETATLSLAQARTRASGLDWSREVSTLIGEFTALVVG